MHILSMISKAHLLLAVQLFVAILMVTVSIITIMKHRKKFNNITVSDLRNYVNSVKDDDFRF